MKPDFEKGNGLIPAIVQDVKTKDVLMLAYVNEEAYERMLTTKETYFYSRSRQELWHKGETSGHFQYISSNVFFSFSDDNAPFSYSSKNTSIYCLT